MREVFISIVFFLSIVTIWTSCFDETFVPSSDGELEFSIDTLRFDTVFTTIGSSTQQLKLYNRSANNVTINTVKLNGGAASKFRINVDGTSSNDVSNIKINANDSLYIFVEVTIDPDEPLSSSPFIISEDLVVESDDGSQRVVLEAWGQNANYFPSKDSKGRLIGLTCNGGTVNWDDDKPYVIYGLLFIDSCGLSISPGVDIYVHGGLAISDGTIFNDGGLFFLGGGYIDARGTLTEPITFQGDRLESDFQDIAGQWAGIRLLAESTGNHFENVTIKNSIVGIRADSASQATIMNTKIENTSSIGLIGNGSSLSVDNSIIHSNGAQSVALVSGGTYRFRHVTMANYENQLEALYIDNFVCYDAECAQIEVRPLTASFSNCIMMGSNMDEMNIVDITDGADPDAMNLTLDHCLIKVDELKESVDLSQYCISCIEHTNEAVFVDQDLDDYHLDTLSIADGQALYLSDLPLDIDGEMRDNQSPDLGCYELLAN